MKTKVKKISKSDAIQNWSRREFLGALGYSSMLAVPGVSSLVLGACSGGSASSNSEPISQPAITSNTASLKIQARIAQISNAQLPLSTNAWSYCREDIADNVALASYLGPTFEQRRNIPCRVRVKSMLAADGKYLSTPPGVTPYSNQMCGQVTLQSDVGVAVHLHGGRVQGYSSTSGIASDGWPLQPMGWLSNPYGFAVEKNYYYPNDQRATMLWYHDHAMDNNSTHVYAGLAGLYIIRDQNDDAIIDAVGGSSREIIYVIQDRIYNSTEQFFDYNAGTPNYGSYSRPEFLGNTLVVNGNPVPSTALNAGVYRFRLLNGCNSRTIALALVDIDALARGSGRVWYTDLMQVIGNDGGLLGTPWHLGAMEAMVISPSQRRDVLLDLSNLPNGVGRLRLVNVSLKYYLESNATTPEAIYTTYLQSVLIPTSVNYTNNDSTIYGVLGNPLAVVANIAVNKSSAERSSALDQVAINKILNLAASDDDFIWTGSQLTSKPNVDYGPNRLILLMSNTQGYPSSGDPSNAEGYSGWSDVQLFELTAGTGSGLQWRLPLNVDLSASSNPPAAFPTQTQKSYTVSRTTFFTSANVPDIATSGRYPDVHTPTITPKAGTYERWYVANVGNPQPLVASGPDMHPFHVHLVNFVVLRRWNLTANGAFQLASPEPLDGIARQDTVTIQSDTLCELLVYFPPGYTGDYVYHCHLLEHEDKCMMSTFTVS